MSTTPEALAPQEPDAPVAPEAAQPDGAEPQIGNEAAPSPAASTVETGDTFEPETKSVQKRFDELTRARREAERRERDLAADRDHWRELVKNQQKPAAAPEPAEKTLADFNFDDKAHQRYVIAEAARTAAEAAKREIRDGQEREAKQRRVESYVERASKFAKDLPDFKEVAESAPISDSVVEIVLGIDSGPEVAYYLGKNPNIAQQINRLSSTDAAYELGRIANRLETEREKAKAAKKLVSTAPPPPKTLGASNPEVTKDPKDMTQPEFNKWRRKQIAARKGWAPTE